MLELQSMRETPELEQSLAHATRVLFLGVNWDGQPLGKDEVEALQQTVAALERSIELDSLRMVQKLFRAAVRVRITQAGEQFFGLAGRRQGGRSRCPPRAARGAARSAAPSPPLLRGGESPNTKSPEQGAKRSQSIEGSRR